MQLSISLIIISKVTYCNHVLKYAADFSLLVPENNDVIPRMNLNTLFLGLTEINLTLI